MNAARFLRIVFKFARELFIFIRNRERTETAQEDADDLAQLEEDLDDLETADDVSDFSDRFFD